MPAIAPQRKVYANLCEKMNADVLSRNRFILMYDKDKDNKKRGVVIAYVTDDGDVRVGWSRCHKVEPFDKAIGIRKAIDRNYTLSYASDVADTGLDGDVQVPRSTLRVLNRVVDKAWARLNK